MAMVTWEKPGGMKVVTNDDVGTVAYAKDLGWKKLKTDDKAKTDDKK